MPRGHPEIGETWICSTDSVNLHARHGMIYYVREIVDSGDTVVLQNRNNRHDWLVVDYPTFSCDFRLHPLDELEDEPVPSQIRTELTRLPENQDIVIYDGNEVKIVPEGTNTSDFMVVAYVPKGTFVSVPEPYCPTIWERLLED